MITKAGQGFEHTIELSAFLMHIESTERRHNALPNTSLKSLVMNDLDVLVRS